MLSAILPRLTQREGERVVFPRVQFPLLSFSSSPVLLFALKRFGWKWSRYHSSLSPSWGSAGSGPGFPHFMFSFLLLCFLATSCASFYALCIFRGPLCGLICMINFIPVFIPIIRGTEHPLSARLRGDEEMPCYG